MERALPVTSTAVYLATFHACEKSIAFRLKSLLSAPLRRRKIDAHKAVEWVQSQLSLSLAPKPDRSRQMCHEQQGHGDNRRAGNRKDNHHQCHSEDLWQTGNGHSAGCSHRQGCKAHDRSHRTRSPDHPQDAGIQSSKARLSEKRGDSLSNVTC